MKRALLLFSISFLLFACEKDSLETGFTMEISIENTTENTISLILFPKSEYKSYPDLYRPNDSNSDPYNGPFVKQSFELEPNDEKSIFSSRNIDQKAYSLTTMVFDSIHVSILNEQEGIRFSLDTAIGYSDNLFNSTSLWDYEVVNTFEYFQISSNPVEIHQYNFAISTGKIKH